MKTCKIEGCPTAAKCREMCHRHYMNWWSKGDPIPSIKMPWSPNPGPRPLCRISDCHTAAYSLGLCKKHYERQRIHGDPLAPRKPRQRIAPAAKPETPCSVEGCSKISRSAGMCSTHYERWRTTGDTVSSRDLTIHQRIDRIGWTRTPAGCLEWNGLRNEHGYGIYSHRRVHRLVYERHHGITLGRADIVRHTCDNPPCGDPEHLRVGTMQDNSDDMVQRRRHHDHGRTHCPNGHDVRLIGAIKVTTRGENLCIKCDAARKARYEARKKARRAA